MTLVEVLFAGTIATGVIGGILVLMLEVAREQQHGLVDATLQQQINRVQDELKGKLQIMSSSESVIFGDGVIESGFQVYRKVIVARGPAPDYPREEIRFQSDNHCIIYDPNRSQTGNEEVLYNSKPASVLRKVWFYPSMKSGGVPDSSILNVWLEMDDNGQSGRTNPDGSRRTNTVVRTYSVKMRNW